MGGFGGKVTIALPRNPRLGLDWFVNYDENMVELVANNFVWFGIDHLDDRGNQYFVFKSLIKSFTQIEFKYKRTHLDSAILNEKTFNITIQ